MEEEEAKVGDVKLLSTVGVSEADIASHLDVALKEAGQPSSFAMHTNAGARLTSNAGATCITCAEDASKRRMGDTEYSVHIRAFTDNS